MKLLDKSTGPDTTVIVISEPVSPGYDVFSSRYRKSGEVGLGQPVPGSVSFDLERTRKVARAFSFDAAAQWKTRNGRPD